MPSLEDKGFDFAVQKLPNLPQRRWFFREEIALRALALFHVNLTVEDAAVDFRRRHVQFIGDLRKRQIASFSGRS